ncbi:hypothetical protein BDM02DRAFT_3129793 [Thelephora ganbajun]|uniref:Uncharacterized protein n=1 Tax=Thelephora ganbajun TaxID=370292 RepID=A0ACB6ZD94_THEGA|nr:hypothetical protein BDM02DRAFT_3129793 [Thelephora ganbajun]
MYHQFRNPPRPSIPLCTFGTDRTVIHLYLRRSFHTASDVGGGCFPLIPHVYSLESVLQGVPSWGSRVTVVVCIGSGTAGLMVQIERVKLAAFNSGLGVDRQGQPHGNDMGNRASYSARPARPRWEFLLPFPGLVAFKMSFHDLRHQAGRTHAGADFLSHCDPFLLSAPPLINNIIWSTSPMNQFGQVQSAHYQGRLGLRPVASLDDGMNALSHSTLVSSLVSGVAGSSSRRSRGAFLCATPPLSAFGLESPADPYTLSMPLLYYVDRVRLGSELEA